MVYTKNMFKYFYKKFGYVLLFGLLFFSSVHTASAQYLFNYFNRYYYEPAIFRYDTEVSGPRDCRSFEKYNYWRHTCSFECYEGQDCEYKLSAVNAEIESLAVYDPNDYVREGTGFATAKNLNVFYQVNKGEQLKLVSGTDDPQYRTLWNIIKYIIPENISDKYITQFKIYSDEGDNTIAYVDDDGNGNFLLAINAPTFDSLDNKDKILAIVHELGHIISYNKNQYVAQSTPENCLTFWGDEECFLENSFLNKFVIAFWSQDDINEAYSDYNNLFSKKESSYTDEYAATNEGEDFAETFAYFVLGTQNFSGEAKQKIDFMNSDTRLVDLKTEIFNGVKRYLTEQSVVN